MADDPQPAPPLNPQTAAIDRLRETTKWLIAAFAAVGAALLAGTQISNIGHARDGRLLLALIGAAAGLFGVVLAIWSASKVLIPEAVTKADFRDKSPLSKLVRKDEGLKLGYRGSLEELAKDYSQALETYEKARAAAQPADASKAIVDAAVVARDEYSRLKVPYFYLRELAQVANVRHRFQTASRLMLVGVLLTAAGLVFFAYGANPPPPKAVAKPPTQTQLKTPAQIFLVLKPAARRALRPQLGRHCRQARLRALLTASNGDHSVVVVLPVRHHCRTRVLTITRADGFIVGATKPYVPTALRPNRR